MISGEELKIGDFGFAKQIATQKQFLTSVVGSPIYMAPQILRGEKYNSKCDVWSFGIIIFEVFMYLLCSCSMDTFLGIKNCMVHKMLIHY